MEEYTIIESDKKQAHVSLWLYAFDLFFILVWAVVAYGLRNMVAIKLRIPYGIFTMACAIMLTFQSKYNHKRHMFQTILIYLQKDIFVYHPIK